MEGNLTDLGRSPIHIDDVIDRLGCMQLQHGLMRFDALWLPTSGANRPLNAVRSTPVDLPPWSQAAACESGALSSLLKPLSAIDGQVLFRKMHEPGIAKLVGI